VKTIKKSIMMVGTILLMSIFIFSHIPISIVKAEPFEKTMDQSQADKEEASVDTIQPQSSSADIPALKTIGNESINQIITAGYKYIGNSVYVFGGGRNPNDIAKGRFDCSSFVQWAFGQAGIDVGSTTDTIKNNGRQVSTNELRPGDLVFFDTYKKDGHVGIYLGNKKFIGSQSSTGVAIADMSTGYWKDRFNGRAIRVIE
jgi:peptidoglycan DL-endopeptidase CwlO